MKNRINERPGVVVCICEKNGNVSLWDPGAWWRTERLRRKRDDEKETKKR